MADPPLYRQLMLSSSMLLGTIVYGRRAYGNCVSVGAPNIECSGASVAQSIFTANAHVTALAGFSVTTGSVNALSIQGAGDLSYADTNFSALTTTAARAGLYVRSTGGSPGSVTISANGAITGGSFGISGLNNGTGGALTITANGDVTGSGATSRGIFALNAGTNLVVATGSGTIVRGGLYGVFARNYGSGATSVTVNGDVTTVGTSGLSGILARGNDVTVTTGAGSAVTGRRYGIFARSDTGGLTVTIDGDVTGTLSSGVYARHSSASGMIAITVVSAGQVTSNGAGSSSAIQTSGAPTNLVVAGTLNGGAGGAVRFDQFSTLADRLELQPTATVIGNVLAGAGSDTLVLGGMGTASFDISAIGEASQYRDFESFVKEGTSNWTLTGANPAITAFTVSGGVLTVDGNMSSTVFTVNAGTLEGSSASLQGNILNNAAVVFDQAVAGTYAGNISGTGSFTKQGASTLILTGSNSYTGGTTVSAGTLQGNTTSLQGNILNNAALVFDQAIAGTYTGSISGSGSLTKQGSGALSLTGTSTYAGATTVTAGLLFVNGGLASSVTVGGDATLGGNATLGGLTVNGGTLAPGNSIGSMAITGNFVQNGGIYQVEVNSAGQGDRTNAGGTAVINGGTVQVLAQSGSYARNTTYTILNATDGVSGAYSAVCTRAR